MIGDVVHNVDVSLKNASPWGVTLLLFAWSKSRNYERLTITTELWTHALQYLDPSGPLGLDAADRLLGNSETWEAELNHGFEHYLAAWRVVKSHEASSQLYSSWKASVGCEVSLGNLEAMQTRFSFASVPL